MLKKILNILFILIIICGNISLSSTVLSKNSMHVWNDLNQTCSLTVDNNMITLESKAGILIEQKTGKVLYEYNSNEKLRPASVTKIMTILLIMEELESGRISLTDVVQCSEKAMNMGGSQIWLDPKDSLTVDEMLKAICVVSANDCCVAMAEYISGSTDEFVNIMNKKAKELGMENTTFKNCHGLDEDGHLTTAYDIALMSRELMKKYPDITKYTTIWIDSLRNGKSSLVNTNKLLRTYSGITGLKTGSTSLALYNVSATATRDGLSLISVIMGGPDSKTRFNEAGRLLDIGFANYTSKVLCEKGVVAGNIPVEKGMIQNIDVVYRKDVTIILKKGEEKGIQKEEVIDEKVVAPIEKDMKIGEVVFKLGEAEVGRTDIIAYYDIERKGIIDNISEISQMFYKLGRI